MALLRRRRSLLDDPAVQRILAGERPLPGPTADVPDHVWDELDEVTVHTTSRGPLEEDVFFVLTTPGGEHGAVVPNSAADEAFVQRLQALPGFDNGALIDAMSSVDDAQFLLWRRTQVR